MCELLQPKVLCLDHITSKGRISTGSVNVRVEVMRAWLVLQEVKEL